MQASSRVSALGLILSLVALAALARGTPRAPGAPATPAHEEASVVVGPLDINTASVEQLVALPRIGPALAARIVEDRDANGPFATLDALDRVPGIGRRTIEVLRPHATVGAPSTAAPRR